MSNAFDFEGSSKQEWVEKIHADLKQGTYTDLIKNIRGLEIEPALKNEDLELRYYPRTSPADWSLMLPYPASFTPTDEDLEGVDYLASETPLSNAPRPLYRDIKDAVGAEMDWHFVNLPLEDADSKQISGYRYVLRIPLTDQRRGILSDV